MKPPLTITLEFLRAVYLAADLEGSRSKKDIFGDRLMRAAAEPTLEKFCEAILRLARVDSARFHSDFFQAVLPVVVSPDAPRVLAWLQASNKLATAILTIQTGGQAFADAINAIQLPEASAMSDHANVRTSFDVGMQVRLLAPLGHGSDNKAGNATLFRRIKVRGVGGSILDLPYYSGNALRGQMRDLLADHFTEAMGLAVSRATPAFRLWFFYSIYSGGALEEKSDATKAVIKATGDNGATKCDGIRTFREMLPGMSLLGCALGNRILPGRVQFSDLRPQCAEWGNGTGPASELMTWEFLTRREDCENHEEHHGMIANTEVLRTGTVLDGGVDMDHSTRSIEKSALGMGLKLMQERGFLGAENRRGFGKCEVEITGAPDPEEYLTHLRENREAILAYLQEVNALPKL